MQEESETSKKWKEDLTLLKRKILYLLMELLVAPINLRSGLYKRRWEIQFLVTKHFKALGRLYL